MTRIITAAACTLLLAACEIDEELTTVNPNAPSIEAFAENATVTELNFLVSGLESEIRDGYELYVTSTGSVARELYRIDADPRNVEDLLEGTIDNNTFYITSPYNNAYRVVKSANLLLEALDNTEAVDEAQKDGYRGVANTFKAYALQRVASMLGSNGIRVDVADPDNLGPFLSESESLQAIEDLYDEAADQLTGAAFAFQLNSGFAGFDSAGTFFEFNRALAARNHLQQREFAEAAEAVRESFYTEGSSPGVGPAFIFSTAPGDFLNPLFRVPGNTGNMIFAHPSWFDDAAEGDERVAAQVAVRQDTFVRDGLLGIYETRKYPSNTSPITIVSNEELHLILAEALAQTDDGDGAVDLLNIVRSLAGLEEYDGDRDTDSLVDEVLRQRRYSLWMTGQRFSDLRRYDRLNSTFLPIDRPGRDAIATEFPIPLAEGL